MRALVFIFLLTAPASAAVNYQLREADLFHDASIGTFTVGQSTFGHITGGGYTIIATDSVTGTKCAFAGEIVLSNPLTAFPSRVSMVNSIRNDAIGKGIKAQMESCLSIQNAELLRSQTRAERNIPNIEGSTVTVP